MAKLSIATGHAMQIYNCLNCPRQLLICIAWPVAMLSFATESLTCCYVCVYAVVHGLCVIYSLVMNVSVYITNNCW